VEVHPVEQLLTVDLDIGRGLDPQPDLVPIDLDDGHDDPVADDDLLP
jgi:hypothetical protein